MRRQLLMFLAGIAVWLSSGAAWAERNWEFSVGGFGGQAFHEDTDVRFNYGFTSTGFEPVSGARALGLRFEDSATYGAKFTAWNLSKQYAWHPHIGLELDWTAFTADTPPQTVPGAGVGTNTGAPIVQVISLSRTDFAVDNLAVNLLFRYPIGAAPDMPQGRWYPYIGVGGGAQRARLTSTFSGHEETSYSPSLQLLTGVKFFLIKYVAIFGEVKLTFPRSLHQGQRS